AVVDPRLAHEVTCAAKATALADFCSQLRVQTGVQLSAGPSVGDEKVTVFCERLPLREVMRQLSRAFGYTWLRSKREGGDYRYEHSEVRAAVRPSAVPAARAGVTLKLEQTELGRFGFSVSSEVHLGGSITGNDNGPYAIGLSPSGSQPENAALNARLAGDPA